ncbi:hypothetical protein LB503_013528 [Fusarium chuoi]|nr:hypothetical protein LB503_013528 [Fusarium chuoi]
MTPTPPSTNSSQGARSPEEQFRVVRKRNRVPLSCYPSTVRSVRVWGPPHALMPRRLHARRIKVKETRVLMTCRIVLTV